MDFKFKTKPYEHQIDCFKYGLEHDRFLLADQQGLGKTKEVIDLAVACKQEVGYKHCLIICGVNGLKWNWFNEVYTHSDEGAYILGTRKNKIGSNADKYKDLLNIDNLPYFIITNIETLRYKVKTGRKVLKRIKRRNTLVDEYVYPITDKIQELCDNNVIGFIAVDECHKVKNPDSEQGSQLLRINSETEIAMTGTPIMNTPLDLFMILKWLGYEDHSFYQFKSHFCRLGGYGGYEIIGYKNLEQLTEKLDTMMLRRLKKDVLDLPEKTYITEYVEMTQNQNRIYCEVLADIKRNIDKIITSINPLSQLIRLRQATGYTGILSSTIQESSKLDRMEELVSEIVQNGEKVVIFSNWTQITTEAFKILSRLYSGVQITGDTPDEERQHNVEKFQNDSSCNFILGTIGAMGTGLTLTSANNVIFLDEPWTMALREQAEDRTHRIGQNSTVNIYFLITKDTIDERIHSIVQDKGDISNAIVDKEATLQYLIS